MTNVQLGSLVLNMELLVYLTAGAAAAGAMKLLRRPSASSGRDASVIWNAALLWLLIWKASLLLIDPVGVLRRPLSLLFFSGGSIGVVLASLTAAGYSWLSYARIYRRSETALLLCFAAAVWGTVYWLAWVAQRPGDSLVHTLGLSLFAVSALLLAIFARRRGMRLERSAERGNIWRISAQAAGALVVVVLFSNALHGQLAAAAQKTADSTAVGARPGLQAPSFELTDVQGRQISLSDYAGQTVLLNFWTTWCRVCRTEMPHVQKLYDEYSGSGGSAVVVLSVNATRQESAEGNAARYVETERLTFPVALDVLGTAAAHYRVSAFPTTVIIDGEGIVRERFVGAISYGEMKKRIERVRR